MNTGTVIDWLMRISGILFVLQIVLLFIVPKIPLYGIGLLLGLFAPQSPPPPPPVVTSYSIINEREVTPDFVSALLVDQKRVGDSLGQFESIKKGDSCGLVWLGINPHNNSVLVFYDYFEDCSCGPGIFGLLRFNVVDGRLNVKPVIDRKMTWDGYFLRANLPTGHDDES